MTSKQKELVTGVSYRFNVTKKARPNIYSLDEWICHHLPGFCGFWRPSHKSMILVVWSINSNELRPTASWHGNGVSVNFVFTHQKLKKSHRRLMIITGVITLVTSVVFWQALICSPFID